MAPEKDDKPTKDRDSISDRETQEIVLPDAPQINELSLDEMTPDMFQSEDVKRILGFTRIIGKIGHAPSVADENDDAAKLVEKILGAAISFKKFAPFVEQLLNGIRQGKLKEEDVVIPQHKLVEALQYWLYYRIEMNFGQSDDQDSQRTRQALIAVLEEKILGDNPETVVTQVMTASVTAETRSFVAGVGKDYLDAASRRQIVDAEQAARRAFEQQFRDQQGNFIKTIAPPGHVPVPNQHAQSGADEEQGAEKKEIERVELEVAFWSKDGDYADREYDTATVKAGGRIDIFDTDNPSEVNARIEVSPDKIVIIKKGDALVFDLDNGVPVEMIEVKEEKPCRIQIGEKMYEITVQIFRVQEEVGQQEPGEDVNAASPGEPAVHEDSQPHIEARESQVINLPAIIGMDPDGNPLSLYACLDEKDKVVTIGTDPSNDIVLPAGKKFSPYNAEIKFLENKRIFANAGKNTIIRFKNSPHNAFITEQPVIYSEDDEIIVGMGGDFMHFKVMAQYPFTEGDIRESLQSRCDRIAQRILALPGNAESLPAITQLEKKLGDFKTTFAMYCASLIKDGQDRHDLASVGELAEQLTRHLESLKTSVAEDQRKEKEAKMALRLHFDAADGETAETPRPFKYAVLVEKTGTNEQTLHVIFPPSLTTGKDPVNALELQSSRVSKYAVQDNECTFVLDGTTGVRMVMEPRNVKNSKILVNGQLPGTREGRTHELDMLRTPLQDGDVVEIGTQRFVLELNHEFTAKGIKQYAVGHLKQIMEVLVLMSESSDEGEKRNAEATLKHFMDSGLVTQDEIKKEQANFEEQKAVREMTRMACALLDNIREQNATLGDYIETDRMETVGLPYDCGAFRAALELLDEEAVNWDATGWTKEQYREQLSSSAKVRLFAYDKKLLQVRMRMQDSKLGTRLIAIVSKDAETQYQEDKAAVQKSFNMLLKEMVSLMKLGVLGQEYEQGWLTNRLSQEQYRQAEVIGFAHDVVGKIHEGEPFTPGEVHQLMVDANGKTYGDFFNYGEVEPETPLEKFVLAKIKARAQLLINEAREGNAISENLARLEELIKNNLLTYEKIESSPEEFDDLRQNEEFFMARNAALKAGREALDPILSSPQPDLEAIVDFSRRMAGNEIAVSDEEEAEFREYCRNAFAAAVEKARFGEMTGYIAVLAMTAVRLKAVKPGEIGTTAEELEHFHTIEETSAQSKEITGLVEEVKISDFHNLHPLMKLTRYLGEQPDSLRYEGQTAEDMITELVGKRLEKMMAQILDGEDPGFMTIIVEDMRRYGFETHIERCVAKGLEDALDELFDGKQSVETLRPFVTTLHLMNLWDVVEKVQEEVIQEQLTRSFDRPDITDIGKRIEEFGEQIAQLGLRNQLPR